LEKFSAMSQTLPSKTILTDRRVARPRLRHGGRARTLLHDLADTSESRVEIETLDICEPDQIATLHTPWC
jgi:hypothetical protein